MDGILDLENFNGGDVDLSKKIAKVGLTDTPFFHDVPKGVPTKTAERWKGHDWKYQLMPTGDDPDGHLGGSAPAGAKSWDYQNSKNHYQIFKDTYGVEGSLEDAKNIEGTTEFQNQKSLSLINHGMTIENGIFKEGQAPIQEDKSTNTAGKMGSLDHWCGVHNTLDLGGTNSLNDDFLRQFLKFGALKGVPFTHIYVNDQVRDQIDDIFKSQIRKSGDDRVLVMPHYTQIKNMAYAPSLKIRLSTKVAQGEIYGASMAHMKLVYQRLSKIYKLARLKDAVEEEVISELTLRINNPHAVAKAKGIKL